MWCHQENPLVPMKHSDTLQRCSAITNRERCLIKHTNKFCSQFYADITSHLLPFMLSSSPSSKDTSVVPGVEAFGAADSPGGLLGMGGGCCCELVCEERLDVEGLRKGKGGVGRDGVITELLMLRVFEGIRGGEGRGLLCAGKTTRSSSSKGLI